MLAGLHIAFRRVFSAVGDLQALVGRVHTTLLSATASPSSVRPLADLFHLPYSDLEVIREEGQVFKKNISIDFVQCHSQTHVNKDTLKFLSFLEEGSEGYDALPFVPRRALVLAPTKGEVAEIAYLIRSNFNHPDSSVAAVDGDSSIEHITASIKNARVIVATTILSTAATMPKLDLCIIAHTSYSVQVRYDFAKRG